ncbi:MAG: SOS response-associated peptidase [Spirosomataceae bacterium]|jgi:putative SOS response-associated peptidase YedK
MCYHLSEISNPRKLARKLGKQLKIQFNDEDFKPRYHVNGFENPLVPVVANADPDYLRFFRWRLIPDWVQDIASFKANTLNAKCEELWEKPSYRNCWQNRCLVVCDGFFEPHVTDPKRPSESYYITSPDNEPLTLGGIYSVYQGKPTFAILTTEANEQMAEVHNEGQRMPVILDEFSRDEWLKPDLSKEAMLHLCRPFEWELNAFRTIDGVFNSRINTNVPEALLPISFLEN